jgi:hypothetical protein|tara:strand:+ start:1270 stop:1545 length:276 start_codon:yes stop_codon:yes gene_type:complete
VPVEELDEDAPDGGDEDDEECLEGAVHVGGVYLCPRRVEPDDDPAEEEELRAEDRYRHASLERALPPWVQQRSLTGDHIDDALPCERWGVT